MRQIVLDTETTGLDPSFGHKIIEIAALEIINRGITGQNFHHYLQPDREIDPEAMQVHGITNEQLRDKPRFADIADEFMQFIDGAELIIHNAEFDLKFINYELNNLNSIWAMVENYCQIIDTLQLARKLYPGQKNNLDALCKRLNIDNSGRKLHGALLDTQLLAEVYLVMTGGQSSLLGENRANTGVANPIRRVNLDVSALTIIKPTPDEQAAHTAYLQNLDTQNAKPCLWSSLQ